MKLFLIAAVAVAVSSAAFAKDLKGTVMTDTEMDKVTAGSASPDSGFGRETASTVANSQGLPNSQHSSPLGKATRV